MFIQCHGFKKITFCMLQEFGDLPSDFWTKVKLSRIHSTCYCTQTETFYLNHAKGNFYFTSSATMLLPPANEVRGMLCFYSRLSFCPKVGQGSLYDITSCLADWAHVPWRGLSVSGPMLLPGGLCLWSHVPSRGLCRHVPSREVSLTETPWTETSP